MACCLSDGNLCWSRPYEESGHLSRTDQTQKRAKNHSTWVYFPEDHPITTSIPSRRDSIKLQLSPIMLAVSDRAHEKYTKNEITNNMHLILKNDCLITGWSPLRWPPSSGAKELKKFEFLIFLPSSSCLAFLLLYRSPGCSQFFYYFFASQCLCFASIKMWTTTRPEVPERREYREQNETVKEFFHSAAMLLLLLQRSWYEEGSKRVGRTRRKSLKFSLAARTAEREMVFRCFGVDSHSVHTAAGEQHIKILFFLFLTLCFELCFYTKPSVVSASLLFRLIFAPSRRTSRDSSGEEAKK